MLFVSEAKTYAKVWKIIDRKEKYTDLQISTSEKDGDKYINSAWWVRAIGRAHNVFKDLAEGDRVILSQYKLAMEKYEAKDGSKKSSLRFIVLDAEIVTADSGDQTSAAKPKTAKSTEPEPESEDTSENPWG